MEFIIFIILFCLSWFFSWTEIALMSLPFHKVNALIKQNKIWSKSLSYIKSNNDKLLITILVWNNLVNVYAAALATEISIKVAKNSWIEQSLAIWISTWIITFFILLFWEIIPKSFATKNAVKVSLFVAPIYLVLMKIMYPIILVIEGITKLFTWWKGNVKITNEEIKSFIDLWREAWGLELWEYERLKNTLKFNKRTLEEIMVPRVKMEVLSTKDTIKNARDFYISHTHSRIPIYHKTIDKIIWILTIRDILEYGKDIKLWDIKFSRVLKAPINQPIDNLLETFQKTRKHIAIVMDEYGWVAWLITLEDIIEEVFWEIRDETDKEEEDIQKKWKNIYIIKSNVLIDDLLDIFSFELKDIWLDKKVFFWETIGYILTYKLERFPKNNEIISYNISWKKKLKSKKKLIFKILSIKDWKIWDIEVRIEDRL